MVLNPKAKCLLDVGSSSELLKGTFTHFFLPFNFSHDSIWLIFTTPNAFMFFPFTKLSLTSFNPLRETDITFVSFVSMMS